MLREALKKVASDGQERRNRVKKTQFIRGNEHFELDFNATWPSVVVFQRFLRYLIVNNYWINQACLITYLSCALEIYAEARWLRGYLNKHSSRLAS